MDSQVSVGTHGELEEGSLCVGQDPEPCWNLLFVASPPISLSPVACRGVMGGQNLSWQPGRAAVRATGEACGL